MTRREYLIQLIDYFAQEALKAAEAGNAWCDVTELAYFSDQGKNDEQLFNVYRGLVNQRPPLPLPQDIDALQNEFLQGETAAKGTVDFQSLFKDGRKMALWQGDITRLKIGAIVNAANSELMGCWAPCHACIDNCIHTYSGTALRMACYRIMKAQGYEEPAGQAKLTKAYNLPAKYVLHTVGPIVNGKLTREHKDLLASCYTSCLDLAAEYGISSVAFCCISTGVFHFPNDEACLIAVKTVREWMENHSSTPMKVVFNVFKDMDRELYSRELEQRGL